MDTRSVWGTAAVRASLSRPSRLGSASKAFLRRAWDGYWNWRARRATIDILNALDERTLHDIGIGASEIESTVYGHRGHRRRWYDEAWWR